MRYRPPVVGNRAEPPSPAVRRIARLGAPIGVLAGLLALTGLVALVINLASGAGTWPILSSLAMIAFWAPIAYGVGVELRRSVRDWDTFLAGDGDEQDPR